MPYLIGMSTVDSLVFENETQSQQRWHSVFCDVKNDFSYVLSNTCGYWTSNIQRFSLFIPHLHPISHWASGYHRESDYQAASDSLSKVEKCHPHQAGYDPKGYPATEAKSH